MNLNLSMNYRPRMIEDVSDGDSNNVWILDKRYVYKKYQQSEQLFRESTGYMLFSQLSSYGIPMMVDKGTDYLVSEFIDSTSGFSLFYEEKSLTHIQIAQKISQFLAEVYWNYRYFKQDKISLFPNISWEDRYVSIITQAEKNILLLTGSLAEEKILWLTRALEESKSIKNNQFNLTMLHRDLHLDNILIQKNTCGRDSNYVIDFEHCMEGPIELELQNSILWNDAWSLPVELIRQQLVRDHAVPYSKDTERTLLSVYFLDQINLAVAGRNREKLHLLIDLYAQRKGVFTRE